MHAIKISESNLPEIMKEAKVEDVDVMEEFIGVHDRFFIRNLNDRRTGEVTDHWATVSEETLQRYFTVGEGDIANSWVRITRRDTAAVFAFEIKTEWIANLARAILPRLHAKSYNDLKGKFLVLDHPFEGHYEVVDPELWEDSDFDYIENGPVIRIKKFIVKEPEAGGV